jgi:uncharacterized membrane protein YdjX (TVP38/TMEM64 family)
LTHWLEAVLLRVAHMGSWGVVWFVVAYVAAAIMFAPAFVLTFAAGAIFGLWRGTLIVFCAALLGSIAVYGLAAPLAHGRVMHRLERDRRVAAIRRAVVGDALWVMFLLRLSPLVPYSLLNYALALSGVRFKDFVLASVGMLPAIVMYAYYGKIVCDVAKLAPGVSPPRGIEYRTLVGIGLIATVWATHLITRAARRAMRQQRIADALEASLRES